MSDIPTPPNRLPKKRVPSRVRGITYQELAESGQDITSLPIALVYEMAMVGFAIQDALEDEDERRAWLLYTGRLHPDDMHYYPGDRHPT